ncbi:ROK family protein [Candidatus Parcubacteria bacterium]|nr:ROK family protein [Candidatus Parcubacteria bacterium]
MYIGVDIGGSKILVGSASEKLVLQDSRKLPTPRDSQEALQAICNLIREIAGRQTIAAIAVTAPGPIDSERGELIKSPQLPWRRVPFVATLTKAFAVPVNLVNDADSAALAETVLGAAQGVRNALYLTLSTGVGSGIIIDGQIYRGRNGTEGGHLIIDPKGPSCECGGRGHMHAMVSGPALQARFGAPGWELTDPQAWDEYADLLAQGLSSMVHLISPEIIVLGGGVSTHFDRFGPALKKHLKRYCTMFPAPPVVQARYSEKAALLGCFVLAQRTAVR